MATSTLVSENELDLEGDLKVNECQLGQTVYKTIIADLTLTPPLSFNTLYSKYILTNITALININLPDVNTTTNIVSGKAQIGWQCLIGNKSSSTQNIQIKTFGGNNVQLLQPGESSIFIAENTTTWFNTTVPAVGSAITLQTAYNNSTDGNINIDKTRDDVEITNVGNVITGSIFNIGSTQAGADSTSYLRIRNNVLNTYSPSLQLMGGVANGTNSIAVGTGTSTTADNSTVIGSQTTIGASATNSFVVSTLNSAVNLGANPKDKCTFVNSGGVEFLSGNIITGTPNNSPSYIIMQGSGNTVNAATTTLLTITTTVNTVYLIKYSLVGMSTTTSTSWSHDGQFKANRAGTLTFSSVNDFAIEDIVGTLFAVNSFVNNIRINITGIAAQTISWRLNIFITQYTR